MQYAEPEAGPASWTLEPDIQIGSVEGTDDAFVRVVRVLPAADGSVILLDQGLTAVMRYLSSGQLAGRVGGAGPGPGEFVIPTDVGWWAGGDSIWVTDGVLPRVTIFSAEGEFGRTIPIDGGGFSPASMTAGWAQPLDDGAIASVVQETGGWDWGPVRVLRVGNDEGPSMEIARAERAESRIPIQWDQPGMMAHPVPDGPFLVFSPHGSPIFVVEREAADSGEQASVRIRTTNAMGELLWEVDLPYQPTPIGNAVRDSINDATREMFQGMASFRDRSAREIDAIFERTITIPSYHPPLRSVVPADDGSIWVVWTDVGGGSEATVVSRDGVAIAQVSVPGGLAAVAGDYAWAIESGMYEVPIIHRHRIVRR
ncbi:MAG: hypothetical protein EA351_05270 [Gemmatimonadales bacterium]|nr:MAG: hypothetical protein EA351_05270 [Gemmatimonadales bacterium]